MQQRNTKKYRLRKEPVQNGVGQSGRLSWTLRLNKNKTQMQNKIQNTNAKCKMQNAKCKMQNAKCKIQNAKYEIQNTKWE